MSMKCFQGFVKPKKVWVRLNKNKFTSEAGEYGQMQDKELSVILWFGGLLFSVIGGLAVFGGSILGYVFTRHRTDNDCDHAEIKDMIKEVKTEIRADIVRLHERIDEHLEVSHE